jgi:endonuclease-8
VEARGKHCLVRFSGDLVLRTHMRMNGSWHLYRRDERWQRARHRMRVLLEVPDFVAVAFDVPVAELRSERALARDPALAGLGPDLLGESFDVDEAVRRARERGAQRIGELLLNQRVAAGIGNVYRAEVLFLCGVHPDTPVAALSDAQLRALYEEARRLLRANLGAGGIGDAAGVRTYAGLRRTTGRSDPSARLWVYGRGGEPCRRCATPLVAAKRGIDARTVTWCPSCQPTPAADAP